MVTSTGDRIACGGARLRLEAEEVDERCGPVRVELVAGRKQSDDALGVEAERNLCLESEEVAKQFAEVVEDFEGIFDASGLQSQQRRGEVANLAHQHVVAENHGAKLSPQRAAASRILGASARDLGDTIWARPPRDIIRGNVEAQPYR